MLLKSMVRSAIFKICVVAFMKIVTIIVDIMIIVVIVDKLEIFKIVTWCKIMIIKIFFLKKLFFFLSYTVIVFFIISTSTIKIVSEFVLPKFIFIPCFFIRFIHFFFKTTSRSKKIVVIIVVESVSVIFVVSVIVKIGRGEVRRCTTRAVT